MALPSAAEARPFYQSAWQRLEDGEYLLAARRTTGAIYLAGYAVECMLKALILAATPRGGRRAVVEGFRGAKAHDFERLIVAYLRTGASSIPADTSKSFSVVNRWTTVLRYEARTAKILEAQAFFRAVRHIAHWADGRL